MLKYHQPFIELPYPIAMSMYRLIRLMDVVPLSDYYMDPLSDDAHVCLVKGKAITFEDILNIRNDRTFKGETISFICELWTSNKLFPSLTSRLGV